MELNNAYNKINDSILVRLVLLYKLKNGQHGEHGLSSLK